mmetsp:Transcript_6197/g.17498  ORF Transcript_6197/g.17498 Transcript_6197/m.17498 type:complete len:370 (+) Transcript_6197:532-1641(+)
MTISADPPGASSENTSLKCFETPRNVLSIASSFLASRFDSSDRMALAPSSNSLARSNSPDRWSAKATNWSRAFLFTFENLALSAWHVARSSTSRSSGRSRKVATSLWGNAPTCWSLRTAASERSTKRALLACKASPDLVTSAKAFLATDWRWSAVSKRWKASPWALERASDASCSASLTSAASASYADTHAESEDAALANSARRSEASCALTGSTSVKSSSVSIASSTIGSPSAESWSPTNATSPRALLRASRRFLNLFSKVARSSRSDSSTACSACDDSFLAFSSATLREPPTFSSSNSRRSASSVRDALNGAFNLASTASASSLRALAAAKALAERSGRSLATFDSSSTHLECKASWSRISACDAAT